MFQDGTDRSISSKSRTASNPHNYNQSENYRHSKLSRQSTINWATIRHKAHCRHLSFNHSKQVTVLTTRLKVRLASYQPFPVVYKLTLTLPPVPIKHSHESKANSGVSDSGNDPIPFQQFQVLFNSLFKVLFIFPSRYLFAIGLAPIFSFRWNLPPTLCCIPKQHDSYEHRNTRFTWQYGRFTRYALLFQGYYTK